MDSVGLMVCEVAVGLMGLGSLALANHCLKQGWIGMTWLGGSAALMCGFLMGVHRGQNVALFAVTATALALATMVFVQRRKKVTLAAASTPAVCGPSIGSAGA
jgi:hypothetical protein